MGRGDWADSRRSEGLVGWGIVDQLGESMMYWCGGCSVVEEWHFTKKRRTTGLSSRGDATVSFSEVSGAGLKGKKFGEFISAGSLSFVVALLVWISGILYFKDLGLSIQRRGVTYRVLYNKRCCIISLSIICWYW